MLVLSHLWYAVEYTVLYFFAVYCGKHIPKVLYGEWVSYNEMPFPWKHFARLYARTTHVTLFTCIDTRFGAFGALFLHAWMYGYMRRTFGVSATFFSPCGAGPSVSCEGKTAELARSHRQSVVLGSRVAGATHVIVVGHEHCAGDTRCNADKIAGTRALARDVAQELPGVPVVAVFFYAHVIGWRPEVLSAACHHIAPAVNAQHTLPFEA